MIMMVYWGKQFWNDFNNWDEWVFQDASRPRDSDKFKLKPWLQSDKWDWRQSNKNTEVNLVASQLMAKWLTKTSAGTSFPRDYWIPYLQESYTASDLSALNWYKDTKWVTRWTAELNTWAETLKAYKSWDPWCIIKDGNIEITQSWAYIVQVFTQYEFPYGYVWSSWYSYIEFIWLIHKVNGERRTYNRTQWRCCWAWDQLTTTHATNLKAWDLLNVWAWHNYSSAVAQYQVINVLKLQW